MKLITKLAVKYGIIAILLLAATAFRIQHGADKINNPIIILLICVGLICTVRNISKFVDNNFK